MSHNLFSASHNVHVPTNGVHVNYLTKMSSWLSGKH